MTPRWIIPVLLCLMIMMIPASARTITAEGVDSYSMVADSGMVIYQITVNDLPIGTNQTHTFNTASGVYLLTIGTYDQWGYKNADISLTLPNGSVQTAHCAALGLLINGYKTDIQYVFPQAYSMAGPLSVSLVLGLTPATASFNSGAMGFDSRTALAFTAVSGNVGGKTNIYVEEMSMDDFKKHVQTFDPAWGLGNLGSQVFQWSWNAVLGFINMIPVIGPIMVAFIDTLGGAINEGYFWLIFTINNFPAILGGVEVLVLMMAVINAGKGDKSMGTMAKNFYSYNLAFILGLIGLVNIIRVWTVSIITMVAKIIGALKPV